MEVASRPPLEPLPDLPVEEPLDAAKPRPEPVSPAAGAAGAKGDSKPATAPNPEQTGLNFAPPEMFLAPGEAPTAVPVGTEAAPPARGPDPGLELELEDPVVDELLTAPPPPVTPAAPVTPLPKPAAAKSPAEAAAERAAARVPIARTASLSAAATKLAAATGKVERSSSRLSATPKPAAEVPIVQPVAASPAAPSPAAASAAAASATPPKSAPLSLKSDAAKAEAAKTDAPKAEAPKLDAPSLASWQSARAAAAPKASTPAAAPPAATSAASARSSPPKSAAPAAAAAAAPATAATAAPAPVPVQSAPMDRDFIARNQVVERYLSGRLPIKGATEFERFCKEHPGLLDEIGLPERVNAGLRLLEASGKPEPWQEAPQPLWQKPQVTLALAAAVVVLAMALAAVAGGNASKSHRIAELQRQATERALDPATSTREIRLLPSRSGASNSPAITIGIPGGAQLADLKIDESRSAYHIFRVTVDRIDQGRVAVINNLAKDSNGHLRIALNTSALGPGNYQLTLEGLDWRGDPQPDSWITIGIQR
jgi:hypothetical protein